MPLFIFLTPPYNCSYVLPYLRQKNLVYRNWITGYKKDGFNGIKNKYANNQESILFFTVSNIYTFNRDEVRIPYLSQERLKHTQGILKNGKRGTPDPLGKLCTDVGEISSDRHVNKVNGKIQKNIHPSPKPEEIIERMIRASSKEGDLVLDLFSGTGTTSAVAKRLGRNFIGCEIKELYYKNAVLRINKEKPAI